MLTIAARSESVFRLVQQWVKGGNAVLALALSCSLLSAPISAVAQPAEPSILRPSQPQAAKRYSFPVDVVDPTAASNPKGVAVPGFRGENQMILYTPAFGPSTETNQAGVEAIVQDGVITALSQGNASIPENGFVISAHGTAAHWLARFAKVGAKAGWNDRSRQITIELTHAAYLNEVDMALKQAEERKPANEQSYQRHLAEAKQCRVELAGMSEEPVSLEMANTSLDCQHKANLAFYNTMAAHPQEFRGVWLRAESADPESVRKAVTKLKNDHIENIFLETYFQGKTAYPSKVMEEYGLATQHPRYAGTDPLRVWVDEAHKQGLKLHVWAQIFFAGNQKANIEQYGPILQKYPQWRNIQRPNWNNPNPVISDIEPGHYFLDPANPEVRTYLEKLLLEVVHNYDVDGLNLDYIRYPASAAPNKGYYLGTTWGYTETARKQFQALINQERHEAEQRRVEALQKAGKPVHKVTVTPAPDPKDLDLNNPLWPRWVEWRKAQVSTFVKTISTKARAERPNLLMSAVIFPSHDPTYAQKLQNYPLWAKEGDIQALTPIGLSTIPERMQEQASMLKTQVNNKIPVYVGIFSLYNRESPLDMLRQIDAVHRAGAGGVVLFDWSRVNRDYEEALQEGPFRE